MVEGLTCSTKVGMISWAGTAPETAETVLKRVEANLNLEVYSGYLTLEHFDSKRLKVEASPWAGVLVSDKKQGCDPDKKSCDMKVVEFTEGKKITYKKDGDKFYTKPNNTGEFEELTESAEKGLMGTNFSTRDTLAFTHLARNYKIAEFKYSPENGGRYYLYLVAKDKNEHYYRREMIVDKGTGIPLVTKFYPMFGLPLKTMAIDPKSLYKTKQGNYYPTKLEYKECGGQRSTTKVTIAGLKEIVNPNQKKLFR